MSLHQSLNSTVPISGHKGSYELSNYFEIAIEYINAVAGILVLFAIVMTGLNLGVLGLNALFGLQINMINPLTPNRKLKVSIIRIRLMLGEWTALALSLLVATDVLDTVLRPSHAFEMNDVLKMGLFTVIRTGVAYFLAKEIKDLEIDDHYPSLSNGLLLSDDIRLIEKDNSDSGHTSTTSTVSERLSSKQHNHNNNNNDYSPHPKKRHNTKKNK